MGSENKILKVGLSIASIFIIFGMVLGGLDTGINLVHQVFVAIGGFFTAAICIVAFKRIRKQPMMRALLVLGLFILIIQAILGQVMIRSAHLSILRGIHFSLSVLALGAISGSSWLAWLDGETSFRWHFDMKDSFARQGRGLVLAAYIALISGVFLAESRLGLNCDRWPVCSSSWPPNGPEWIPFAHRLVVGIVALFLLHFAQRAWKEKRSEKIVLTLATSLSILYLGQAFIGAFLSVRGDVDGIGALHAINSAILVVVGGALVIFSGMRDLGSIENQKNEENPEERNQRMKDFLSLNKPVVVLLLLTTTLGGMVMGFKGFPPLRILFVTLISGALAAGGSGAVNQFIDKDIDQSMTRTANRPIPAGRLTPAEGLAYGVGALLVSFYLMAGLVNMLSAILTLVGMVYYIFLYSMLLKKRSVQNIVIGGGAGAIPPLVGWAAATGSLDITALFLFLIIFLWTPPHFWALALTRKNEYAKAGIPMMPVERGDEATEKMIFIYSIILVGTTIFMWGVGLTGWLFLIAAIFLGAYLIWLSWQVFRNGRNKVYYRMYRHSNYYLLFLFIFLAIDSVLI